jgi:glyoxylase-like metal-dependent hydrolase (beta-lactamase superfamily II)
MPKHIDSQIEKVSHYSCGYCVNELAIAYRGHKLERRKFPSGVFLIKHATKGYLLFDTGYSRTIYKAGFKAWIYRTLNPTYVTRQDEILTQLQKEGIRPADIKYVVISHLHPDHIGGIQFFPNSKFILSEGSYATFKQPKWNDLLIKALIPSWFEDKIEVLQVKDRLKFRDNIFGYDLFNDGSLILTELEGHTHGHLGAYIPGKLMLAGDACWGEDLMESSKKMRRLIQHVNNDYKAFKDSLDLLAALEEKGIELYFSHDQYSKKDLL